MWLKKINWHTEKPKVTFSIYCSLAMADEAAAVVRLLAIVNVINSESIVYLFVKLKG